MEFEKSLKNGLYLATLNEKTSSYDIPFFAEIVNKPWGDFFQLTPEILGERIKSGEVFVGAYFNNNPVGILETISLNLREPGNELTFEERMKYICPQIGDYRSLTNDGRWSPRPKNPNTILFVDVTVKEGFTRKYLNGPTVFTGMIDFAKDLAIVPQSRPEEFESLKYALTFTPDEEKVRGLHRAQKALDTNCFQKGARPGHSMPDVGYMCYMSLPEFWAAKGEVDLQKSA